MKIKILSIILTSVFCIASLSGCSNNKTEITPEEFTEILEEHGCTIETDDNNAIYGDASDDSGESLKNDYGEDESAESEDTNSDDTNEENNDDSEDVFQTVILNGTKDYLYFVTYYGFEDEKSSKEFYEEMVEHTKENCGSDMTNKRKRCYGNDGMLYYYTAEIGDTVICATTNLKYEDEVNSIIEDLGY